MNQETHDLSRITDAVIGRSFAVLNTLGAGFLEKVYENALARELRKAGMNVYQQCAVDVTYDGVVVGSYFADILVENAVVVELKVVNALAPAHTAQGLNYLRATGLPLCLLLNFGNPKLQVKRVAHPSVRF
jgi:GxxExxY protein